MTNAAQAQTTHDKDRSPDQTPLWLYFLAIDGGRLIKIGKSRTSRGVRLAQHSAPALDGRTPSLTPLCEVRATADVDESFVQRYFVHLRASSASKEIFHPGTDLIDYIRWLRDEHYVSVPEDSDETRNGMPLVGSEHWLPRPDRVKPRDVSLLPFGGLDLPQRIITADDFYTNDAIIAAARGAMGSIDLDPASHAMANRVVRAARFFTIATNGLTQEWGGNVWCNPPFGDWAQWARKILAELDSGRVQQLCALAATRTITAKYFSPLLEKCDGLCITRGRIPFWGGHATGSPDDGHVILYFGERITEFCAEFKPIGIARRLT